MALPSSVPELPAYASHLTLPNFVFLDKNHGRLAPDEFIHLCLHRGDVDTFDLKELVRLATGPA